ncbi:MAG: sensor histidine kinase [Chloroflexi bacterium]|nr:sensor histidine kinase [Chloroflexota bacterium]
MNSRQEVQQAAALIETAADLVRYQLQRLQSLANKAKLMQTQCMTEQQQVQIRFEEIASDLSKLEHSVLYAADGQVHSDITRLCQERDSLTGRQSDLVFQLASLQKAAQRLNSLINLAEFVEHYALGETDPAALSESYASRLTQLRILQAQEGERQRLAREIHDGPAQVLANAIFELEYCERLIDREPDQLRRELSRLKGDVRDGLVDVRQFIFDLRPTPVRETGLPAMIRHYAENYQARFHIAVNLDLSEVGRLPSPEETAIYRIIQEALQNAQKHSRASAVTVALHRGPDYVQVAIADDGIGFEVPKSGEEQPGHFGLMTMRERAQLIGGRIDFVSAPGRGTTVTLAVPSAVASGEKYVTTD